MTKKKDLELENANINGLEIRLYEQEKEHKGYKKQQEMKLKEQENLLKVKTKKLKVNETTMSEFFYLIVGSAIIQQLQGRVLKFTLLEFNRQ